MLVTLKDVLERAKRGNYAVGAFNITNGLCLSPLLKAAEAQRSPVIINIAEISFEDVDILRLYPAIIHSAKEATVPVVVNLDHGLTEKALMTALRCGFSSVMFDATKYSYEDNIRLTKQYADMAHSVGVSLEGELGVIGGSEAGEGVAVAANYTDLRKVRPYVDATGVDALAVSIGNVHGFYKGEPNLQFDLLADIAAASAVPLVLHGGSGISDDDFRKAVSLGICKINFYTGSSVSVFHALNAYMKELNDGYADMAAISWTMMNAFQKTVEERMQVFGSAGKA
ncbi:class II fructose-bisphosphate aldolase [Sediminispirochaeta bajacaliforniensis]|uniref:class II fructose-bisphosphate aldolase n=1 Tax=Sediminispirochaeta bajacaliforniensis TaxID=148 RepID=UPI0003662AF3|nr:class II fructose-bisphosphate aldolase [Sediminispirochaeta bajacaliforniensis]